MVAPDLVLTAAHCVFDSQTRKRIDPIHIEFRAGWRNGRASAYRGVNRIAVHSDYEFDGEASSHGVRNDIALLELDKPIRNGRIVPFDTAVAPGRGDSVGVVSYAKNRSEAPSLQDVCSVLGQQDGVLVTSCYVDFGASGAPIFSFSDGRAKIVSVVSAKAEIEGERVSLGTSLHQPLAELQADLIAGRNTVTSARIANRRVTVGEDSRTSSAKFVKP